MEKANRLGKRSDQEVGVGRDNKNKKLLKPEQFEVRAVDKGEVLIEEVDVLKKIKRSKIRDNEVVKAVDKINRIGVKVL